MRPARLAATAVTLLTAACGDTPSESPGARSRSKGSRWSAWPRGSWITNDIDRPLAYAVWARGFLALFAPCIDPSPGCVRLDPRGSVIVPLDHIEGMWPDEREAIVRWWRVVPDGTGGYRAEGLREVIVTL